MVLLPRPKHQSPTEIKSDEGEKVYKQIVQICGQLKTEGLSIGMLYTDAAFWFMRYDADSDCLEVSPCILASQHSPVTAVGALLFAGSLSLAMESMRKRPSSCSPPPADPPGFNAQLLSSLESSTSPLGHQNQPVAGASVEGDSNSSSYQSNARLGHILGSGITGTVRECQLDGYPDGRFAIKVSNVAEGSSDLIAHEASIYRRLHSLQGTAIPELVDYGVMLNSLGDCFPYLLTSLHGSALSEMTTPLHPEQEVAVLNGLAAIHSLGVLHG